MSGVVLKSRWRVWGAFRIAVILIVAACIGMAGVLTVVSHGIDAHQRDREEELVSMRLKRALETIGEDLTAGSMWDDAVTNMAAPAETAWFDRFLGGFYSAQSQHVATLGYDETGRLIRISRDGAPAGADADNPFAIAARPLVDALRVEAAGRDRTTHAKAAVRLRAAFVRVEGHVYVVGVSNIVRHTAEGPTPATDPLVASFKPFDSVVQPLRTRLSLTDVAFQPGVAAPPEGMTGVDVRDPSGDLLGRIVWQPERPGNTILTHAGPLMLLMLAIMVVGGGALLWRLTQDIRRLRASEAALSAALHKAEAANAAKSRFLSNISHELRTPLNGVLGMAEIIGHDLVTPQQRDRLDILKASGQTLLRLIEELLDVVRLGDGAVTMDSRAFRADALLRGIVAEHQRAARAKGLALKVESVREEWLGDAVHIEKLLAALIDNAVRFTAAGQITVRALARDGLTLEVQDTGPGMEPAVVAGLFDAFAQGDDSRTRAADGLGLGLTVAHGLANLMGGRIEVESTPGEGSLFRVVLPLTPVRLSEAAAA